MKYIIHHFSFFAFEPGAGDKYLSIKILTSFFVKLLILKVLSKLASRSKFYAFLKSYIRLSSPSTDLWLLITAHLPVSEGLFLLVKILLIYRLAICFLTMDWDGIEALSWSRNGIPRLRFSVLVGVRLASATDLTVSRTFIPEIWETSKFGIVENTLLAELFYLSVLFASP